MKKKIIIIISSIIGLLIIGFGIYFIVQAVKPQRKYGEIDKKVEEKTTDTEAKDVTKDVPTKYKGYEVVNYTLSNVKNKKEFKVETKGETKALFFTQKISNERVIKDNKAMITTVSLGIKNVVNQRYYNNNKVLYREGSTSGDSFSFNDDTSPKSYTYDEMLNMYGWMPFEANGYYITLDTYLDKDFGVTDLGNGKYSVEFDLKPGSEYGPKYYQREILTTSGSKDYPEFKMIHLKFTIDKDFNLLTQEIKEEYKVNVAGFVATSHTEVIDTFSYTNVDFKKEYIEYFNKY